MDMARLTRGFRGVFENATNGATNPIFVDGWYLHGTKFCDNLKNYIALVKPNLIFQKG